MISVIIPTYEEEDTIGKTLEYLFSHASKKVGVLVVDASPNKRTQIAAKRPGVKVIQCSPGRAKQMNTGALKAKGNIFLFLHADTLLPENWDRQIEEAVEKGFVGGGFLRRFDSTHWLLRLNTLWSNFRLKIFRSFLGDNAIFVTKEMYLKLGGFKELPILEDLDFSRRMKTHGSKTLLSRVVTSARRFEERGVAKIFFLYLWVHILYSLGFGPQRIHKMIERFL